MPAQPPAPRHRFRSQGRRAVTAAGAAGLLLTTPVLAACGGSGGGGVAKASLSVGASGAQASVSVSQPPSVSVSGSVGPLKVGQDVTLTGTVTQILGPGGYFFVMTRSGTGDQVAVAWVNGGQLKVGDSVTTTGMVANLDVATLIAQLGARLGAKGQAQLRQLHGLSLVQARTVTVGGAGSASPSVSPSVSS